MINSAIAGCKLSIGLNNIVKNQGIVLEELDYDYQAGFIDPASLPAAPGDFTALVIPQPNFFGSLEEVDQLTDWAHKYNALVIAVVNPTSLAILTPPGEWGEIGADMVCGDGQPLGAPLSSGGPYFGFMCCRQQFVRQMPGRIIGRTEDLDGKPGYTLTLQAREQHIRRSKATSNICTNQGLMVTAATIYMTLLGAQGLQRVAQSCHKNTVSLITALADVNGVTKLFNRPVFHEAVVQLDLPVADVQRALSAQGIIGGVSLAEDYPELGNALLLCATETKTEADIKTFTDALVRISKRLLANPCPVQPKIA